jgi:ribose/xylose/arabinose/galactoside ABC-type transport system permease subunit
MVQGRYFDRTDLDTILEAVSQDYEAATTTRTVLQIAFPIVVVLLLVALVWFVVRRRKANQVSV